MSSLPTVFRRFVPQLLHVIVLPVFFFTFFLIYRPLESQTFLGSSFFGVHITLLSCIILASTIIARSLYYYLPMKLNYTLYIFWCLGEMIFMTFFIALYVWLVLYKDMPYFQILTSSFRLVFFTLVIPYSTLALSIRVYDYHEKSLVSNEHPTNKRMRFYDQKHNLKLVLMPETLLYISSDENYVNIYYVENDRLKSYVLRSSMKALEDMCVENGMVRCHRQYLINPQHVQVLRKEQDGVVYAELDTPGVQHIPVTKRYYASVSALL